MVSGLKNIVGIICEYNPFHNGHVYHLEQVKKLFPESIVILVMSGNFTERGIPSVLDKWDKTEIALEYGIDLVVELPFPFATQSADVFASGAIQILKALKAEYLVFGSEQDISKFYSLANISLYDENYKEKVQEYMDLGENYPTALSMALSDVSDISISSPNDLLAFSYIKEIIRQDAKIEAVRIERTNSYHDTILHNSISSATSIRKALLEKKDISLDVPEITYQKLKRRAYFQEDYFPFLKYKIQSSSDLSIYQTVDEGIENRILSVIDDATSWEDLCQKIKTKRYTYNKINRMLIHILCDFTKKDAKNMKNIEYIRILGFNKFGQEYLNSIKKICEVPIVTNFSKKFKMLALEKKVTAVYLSPLSEDEKVIELKKEYQNPPKKKEF